MMIVQSYKAKIAAQAKVNIKKNPEYCTTTEVMIVQSCIAKIGAQAKVDKETTLNIVLGHPNVL